jgi:L-lactate dehydrogenase complex protein LldE
MIEIIRPAPRLKTASLFVTCMVDMIFPDIGISTVKILDHLGIKTDFPTRQTCCGQPAHNGGFHKDAKKVARNTIHALADSELVVVPSGSCAAMIRQEYPAMFQDDPSMREKATWVASITWELTEFLVDGLGVTDIGAKLSPMTVAYHDACHGLRMGGLKQQGRKLVTAVEGVTLVEMPGAEECCGFGGLFSVKMPEISTAMLKRKLAYIEQVDADHIVSGDAGCMAQMNGGLSRNAKEPKVMHIADFLAQGL